jgi:hypothetical protein
MNQKSKRAAVMKEQQPTKARYTPKPVPANSGAFLESPLNTTTRVKVVRWHDYSGKPTLFQVVDGKGRLLCWFPYEPDALAHCEALEAELGKPEQQQ